MVRTQIQLDEGKYSKLRQVAAKQGRSMADCIREAINLFLQKSESQTADIAAIAGKYTPMEPSRLKAHDRWWAEAILGDDRSGAQ